MSDYIIWVQRGEDSWERLDAPTLEFARMVFNRQRTTVEHEVAMTRLVETAGPAPARVPGATPVFGTTIVPSMAANIPATPDVATGTPDAAAVKSAASTEPAESTSSASAAGGIMDTEIRLLNLLKEAFRELDQPTVWRIVRWAQEYAKGLT